MATIRLATAFDSSAIAAIYRPYCEESAVSFEQVAPTAVEMAKRIATVTTQRPWIVLEDNGTVVGYAYAGAHHERWAYRWSVNTAIYIRAAHQRRGAGRALYVTLFDLLRHLGYYRAAAGITLPNEASVGLHAALGFTLVGVYRDIGYKLGAWRDVAWYEADIQPLVAEPQEPRAMAALSGSQAWRDAVACGLAHYKAEFP
jgi:L-amino acid N-acyltransferase YncA